MLGILAPRVQAAWLRKGFIARLLWPMSQLYRALVSFRKALYRSGVLKVERVDVPVIVIGNVVAGGSGKTPVVIALVQHLQSIGLKPGVVSRGYGRDTLDCREVVAEADPNDTGDEPMLIHMKTGAPVVVGKKRVDAARKLLHSHPDVDVIVSDDGLQHFALHRDVEVCVFDDRGVGNGYLLPAGPLREPWPRPVDVVLHSGERPAFRHGFVVSRQLALRAVGPDQRECWLADINGKSPRPLLALAGIANPAIFFSMLTAGGVFPDELLALPDHHNFGMHLEKIDQAKTVICTEKDAVKLWRIRPDAWAVALEVALDPQFLTDLERRLALAIGQSAPP